MARLPVIATQKGEPLTFGERVRVARERLGWSQSRLAREIGVKQPSIFQMEQGDVISKHILQIARKTGVRAEWLESGEEPMLPSDALELSQPTTTSEVVTQFSHLPVDLPIIGAVGGKDGGQFSLSDRALDHARRPRRLIGVPDAYALYVRGDTMAPWREEGEVVIVHPHQPPKPNDYVVIRIKDESRASGEATLVRRLLGRHADTLKVLQYNPRRETDLSARQIVWMHRVVDWSEALN